MSDEVNPIEDQTYMQALAALYSGSCAHRYGWNGKGMYLVYVSPEDYSVSFVGNTTPLVGFIGMFTADGKFTPWVPSSMDQAATDWVIV